MVKMEYIIGRDWERKLVIVFTIDTTQCTYHVIYFHDCVYIFHIANTVSICK